jgi:hypothetical protein
MAASPFLLACVVLCVLIFVCCGVVVECENGFVEFGPIEDPDDIFNTWNT